MARSLLCPKKLESFLLHELEHPALTPILSERYRLAGNNAFAFE
jgi:hypothetical protein